MFPKVVDERFLTTGTEWQAGATNHATIANDRIALAKEALSVKKQELGDLKKSLKHARKDKDFVKVGTLEGSIKTEEIVVDVLQRFKDISEAQMELSGAWRDTGDAIIGFVDADRSFEAFRSLRITRPAQGETDQRLKPDGYRAFEEHTKSLELLGKAFEQLGDKMQELGSVRMKTLGELEKGGQRSGFRRIEAGLGLMGAGEVDLSPNPRRQRTENVDRSSCPRCR